MYSGEKNPLINFGPVFYRDISFLKANSSIFAYNAKNW
jgi:hypothetical protein